jgi:hypothetical protein
VVSVLTKGNKEMKLSDGSYFGGEGVEGRVDAGGRGWNGGGVGRSPGWQG